MGRPTGGAPADGKLADPNGPRAAPRRGGSHVPYRPYHEGFGRRARAPATLTWHPWCRQRTDPIWHPRRYSTGCPPHATRGARMSSLRSCSAATALILAASLSPALLVAQQDSTMMSHDSMMAMPADTGMAMSHDSTMMDHGGMMNHMDAMSFTGAAGQKAAGGYELAENPGGKRQL